jgi:putative oxidoreductase
MATFFDNIDMILKLLMFGSLPIRILAGIAFIVAGLPKLENISANQGFLVVLGFPPELILPMHY